LGAISVNNDKIYVIEGKPSSGLAVTNVNEFFKLDKK